MGIKKVRPSVSASEASDDNLNREDDESCGIQIGCGSCRSPRIRFPFLDCLNNAKCFLCLLSLAVLFQGMIVNGLINIIISTIEKRFHLQSSETGFIAGCYDLGFLIVVFFVTYVGGRGHKPQWIGWGVFIMGLGSITFSLPHFVAPTYKIPETDSYICSDDMSLAQCGKEYLKVYRAFFIVGHILHGIGACGLFTLVITYLDANVKKNETPLYHGIYFAFSVAGPGIGFIAGGAFIRLYTNLGEDQCNVESTVEGCHSNESLSIVSDLCNGRSECPVDPGANFPDDPCVGKEKYLNVVYSCLNSSASSTESTATTSESTSSSSDRLSTTNTEPLVRLTTVSSSMNGSLVPSASSTEAVTTYESTSLASDGLSTTNTELLVRRTTVSSSMNESLVPTSCSVKQSISGYTFPPTQPGLNTYSEEKCSDDENISLASILCSTEDYYNAVSLRVSKCSSIDSAISAPLSGTTLEDLDFATANVSALNATQVEQVVEYLNNISNLNIQYSQKEIMEAASIISHISEYYITIQVSADEFPIERQNLVRSYERILRRFDSENTSNLSVYTHRVNVEVSNIFDVDSPYVFNATFYEDKTSNVVSYPMTITIPVGALIQAQSLLSTIRIVSVGYRSSVLFPCRTKTDWVISSSIGNSTHALEGIVLNDPVIIRSNGISGPSGLEIVENEKVVASYECVFWDFNIGNWSTSGCSLVSSKPTTCQCNHLTNFAILMSGVELPVDPLQSIITHIGVGLSVLGLLLTLLIICLSQRLRKKYQMQILGNICLSLAVALTLFVTGVHYQVDTVYCTILTALMHLFFLASFTWTAVYSYSIYQDIAQVMASYSRRFKIKYAAFFGYGVPTVIVLVNAGITLGYIDPHVTGHATKESSYRARNFCWLQHYSLYFGFLLPVALLLLYSVVIYGVIVPKITCEIAQIQSTKSKRSTMQNLATCVCLATTMGLSWTAGYLMLVSDDRDFLHVMSYLFTVTTSFQGVIIFYLTAIKRCELRKLFAPQKSDSSMFSTRLSTTYD